jgi:hypothetical protein
MRPGHRADPRLFAMSFHFLSCAVTPMLLARTPRPAAVSGDPCSPPGFDSRRPTRAGGACIQPAIPSRHTHRGTLPVPTARLSTPWSASQQCCVCYKPPNLWLCDAPCLAWGLRMAALPLSLPACRRRLSARQLLEAWAFTRTPRRTHAHPWAARVPTTHALECSCLRAKNTPTVPSPPVKLGGVGAGAHHARAPHLMSNPLPPGLPGLPACLPACPDPRMPLPHTAPTPPGATPTRCHPTVAPATRCARPPRCASRRALHTAHGRPGCVSATAFTPHFACPAA